MEELMKLKDRKIIINKTQSINLKEKTLFNANGDEGLHLWESSIVLSRYIIKYKQLFEGKKIIELGSGCGLVGLTCLKYTNCNDFTFTDYQPSVLDNLKENITLNSIKHQHISSNENTGNTGKEINTNNQTGICLGCYSERYKILNIDWRDYEKYNTQIYDYIIGSELIYIGGFIEELVKLIFNLLSPNGKALITMPTNRSKTLDFLKFVEDNKMFCTFAEVKEEDLLGCPLENEKEYKKLFENIVDMKIVLYEITKIK